MRRKSEIKADFFDNCDMIPDPKELSKDEKNLLILDDCFLGPQNKAEAYYTRGRQNNCDTELLPLTKTHYPREYEFPCLISARCKKPLSHIRRSL